MTLNSIQIIAILKILIVIIKLLYMFFKKKSLNTFIQSYNKFINKNSYMVFTIYLSLSLISLYFLRLSDISYTLILANSMFFGFLINSGFIAMPSLYNNFDFSKINWKMIGIYTLIWLYIMFRSIQEIFNF